MRANAVESEDFMPKKKPPSGNRNGPKVAMLPSSPSELVVVLLDLGSSRQDNFILQPTVDKHIAS